MTTPNTLQLAEIERDLSLEMARVKSYFPYRIVFGVIDKETFAPSVHTAVTMAKANRMSRQGHAVFVQHRDWA